MANYFITGVWFDDNGRISHVLLHEIKNDGGWKFGVKTTEKDAIKLKKAGSKIMTKRWNYTTADWVNGADVIVVNERGDEYLRTVPDASVTDNLQHMIRMKAIV